MIRGFTNNGLFREVIEFTYKKKKEKREAIKFYCRMGFERVRADNFTYPFVIKACIGLLSLMEWQKVHGKLFKIGLDLDVYDCNSLIIMYAKMGCVLYSSKKKMGCVEFAERVFGEVPVRDLVSWNSVISCYVSVGDCWSSWMCLWEL